MQIAYKKSKLRISSQRQFQQRLKKALGVKSLGVCYTLQAYCNKLLEILESLERLEILGVM